jgi:hypothetical protein
MHCVTADSEAQVDAALRDGSRFDAYRFQTTLGPEIRRRILALVLDTLH